MIEQNVGEELKNLKLLRMEGVEGDEGMQVGSFVFKERQTSVACYPDNRGCKEVKIRP